MIKKNDRRVRKTNRVKTDTHFLHQSTILLGDRSRFRTLFSPKTWTGCEKSSEGDRHKLGIRDTNQGNGRIA